jgi:hypothetical protein
MNINRVFHEKRLCDVEVVPADAIGNADTSGKIRIPSAASNDGPY